MLRAFVNSIAFIIGFLASTIAVDEYVLKHYGAMQEETQWAVKFLGLFAAYFFMMYVWTRSKWDRVSRYGETVSLLSEGLAKIHKLSANSAPVPVEIAAQAGEVFCQKVAQIYSTITASSCSVTIKLLKFSDTPQGRQPEAITLCRSSHHRKASNSSAKHWIDKNTDFHQILVNFAKPQGRYFFSNALPFLNRYKNTSFECYGEPHDTNPFLRWLRWPLPYRATIVAPICPPEPDDRKEGTLIGFLCVDSVRMYAFKKDFDIDLLSFLSDSLYNFLSNMER